MPCEKFNNDKCSPENCGKECSVKAQKPKSLVVTGALSRVWPKISDRVVALHREYARFVGWSVKDVFFACKDKKAFIFLTTEYDGFLIVKTIRRNDENILFVWIASAENGKREQNMAVLREIARNAGCTKVEFESPRKGFDRDSNWQRAMTVYQAEV